MRRASLLALARTVLFIASPSAFAGTIVAWAGTVAERLPAMTSSLFLGETDRDSGIRGRIHSVLMPGMGLVRIADTFKLEGAVGDIKLPIKHVIQVVT